MAKRTAFGPPRRKRGQKGMFLGGIFGQGEASGPGSFSSASSSGSTKIDPGGNYYPLEQNILGTGQQILDTGYQPYDVNNRFADFTADQLAAQQGIRSAQGNWRPAFDVGQGNYNAASSAAGGVGTAGQTAFNTAAGGPGGLGAANPYLNRAAGSWTDPGTAQAWMNPYQQNVTDATTQQAMEAWSGPGGALQGLTDKFTGGGTAQFGRERMGDIAGKMSTDFGRGLSQTLATVNQQGYNQGMTAFGNEQQRLAGLGQTAGGLGVQDITAQTNLGTAQTNAATAGVNANLNAGQGQLAFGNALQGANYKDIQALNTSGQQQQALNQQRADFLYQQNREQVNFPFTRAQQAQSLAQGWQLPTSTSSQSWTNAGTTVPTGSVAGNVLGAATSIAGMSTGKNSTVGGDVISWLGGGNNAQTVPGSTVPGNGTVQVARGGHLAFGPGGQVPVVRAMRQRNQMRQPAIMARLQAAQGPGITPGQTPGMMPPKPAFASGGHFPVQPRKRDYEMYHPIWQDGFDASFAEGGHVDEAQDREMMRRAVWAHERAMHDAKTSELTPLKRFAFGGRVGYADGGLSMDPRVWWGGNTTDDAGGNVMSTSNDLGAWYDKREAQRRYNTAQRRFEAGLRMGEYGAEAEADPAKYWKEGALQTGRGIADLARIAGLPGTLGISPQTLLRGVPGADAALTAFGINKLPTMDKIGGWLDTAFGEPTTAGGRAGRDVGQLLPNALVPEAAPFLTKNLRLLERLKHAADYGANALGLKEILGAEYGR